MMGARRPVDLSPVALLRAGVSGALAFAPEAGAARSWTIASRPRANAPLDAPTSSAPEPPEAPEPIAVVQVLGPLRQRATWEMCEGMSDGYDAIEARVSEALSGDGVTDLVLVIDSPGGEAAGLLAACRRIRRAADSAGVRLWTVADEVACSAGYALLCLGDPGRVFCPTDGIAASVGVVWPLMSAAGVLEQEGYQVRVVRSGDRKAKPSGIEPIEDADVAQIQSMVDSSAAEFAAWVSERRGLSADAILGFKGAMMTGTAARAAGLVDGHASAHEVLAMATAEAALSALREAMGLSADASLDTMKARASEGREAISALAAAREGQAKAEGALLAYQEATAKAAARNEAAQRRAAFVSEVETARAAGLLSPDRARSLIGDPTDPQVTAYYDRHGEAAARETFAALKSEAPPVPRAGATPGAVPAASPGLTAWERSRAKALGMSEADYAVEKAARAATSTLSEET